MELSIADIRELLGTSSQPSANVLVGKKVLIRTVTFYYTGFVVAESDRWIVLEDAAWIANTGKFSTALKTGQLNEVEPYPDGAMWVSANAVVDVSEWKHDLPRSTK